MPQAIDAPRTTRIVLVESHVWFRDCLAHALISFLPDVTIEGADSVEGVVPGPAALLLIGIHPQFRSAQLRDAIDTLRRVGDGSPVGAYLHSDNGALARLTARLGVAGIVMPNAGVEIVVASVRVMAAGGNFLPPEVAGLPQAGEAAREEPLAQATAQESRAAAESLTSRELEVLQLLGAGRTNKGIAADLSISQSTVKVHLRRMMKKLGTTNRTEAALQLTRRAQPQVGAD
jgi:DNA-binding NarL/FixJ family response regulator